MSLLLFRLMLVVSLLKVVDLFGWSWVGGSWYGLLPPSSSSRIQASRFIVVSELLVSSIHSRLPSFPSGLGKISVIMIGGWWWLVVGGGGPGSIFTG